MTTDEHPVHFTPRVSERISEGSRPGISRARGVEGLGAIEQLAEIRRRLSLKSDDLCDPAAYLKADQEGFSPDVVRACAVRGLTDSEKKMNVSLLSPRQKMYHEKGGPLVIMLLRISPGKYAKVIGKSALKLLQMTRVDSREGNALGRWCSLNVSGDKIVLSGLMSEAESSAHGSAVGPIRDQVKNLLTFLKEKGALTKEKHRVLDSIHAQCMTKKMKGITSFEASFSFLKNAAGTISTLILHRNVASKAGMSTVLGSRLIDMVVADARSGNLPSEGRIAVARSRILERILLGEELKGKIPSVQYSPIPQWLADVPFSEILCYGNIDKIPVPHPQHKDTTKVLERDSHEVPRQKISYDPLARRKRLLQVFLDTGSSSAHHPSNVFLDLATQAGLLAPRSFASRNNVLGFALYEALECEAELAVDFPKITKILNEEKVDLNPKELRQYAEIMQECALRACTRHLAGFADHAKECPGVHCKKGEHLPAAYASVVRKGDKERFPKVFFELVNFALGLVVPGINHVLREQMHVGKVLGGVNEEAKYHPLEGKDLIAYSLDAKSSTDFRSIDVIDNILAWKDLLRREHFSSECGYEAVMMALTLLRAPQATLADRPCITRFNACGCTVNSFSEAKRMMNQERASEGMPAVAMFDSSIERSAKKPLPVGEHLKKDLKRLASSPHATPFTENLSVMLKEVKKGGLFIVSAEKGSGKTLAAFILAAGLGTGSIQVFGRTAQREDAQKTACKAARECGIKTSTWEGEFQIWKKSKKDKGRPPGATVGSVMEFFAPRLIRNARKPMICFLDEINMESTHRSLIIREAMKNPCVTLVLQGAGDLSTVHYESLGFKKISIGERETREKKIRYVPETSFAVEIARQVERQKEAGGGVVLIYQPSTSKCDQVAQIAKDLKVSYGMVHGQASQKDRAAAIEDVPPGEVRVVAISTAGVFGFNYDRCFQIGATPFYPIHGFCVETGTAVAAEVELTPEFWGQLLERASRRKTDLPPEITVFVRSQSTGLRLSTDFMKIDLRAEYASVRSQTSDTDLGPYKNDLLIYSAEETMQIIDLAGPLPPLNVQQAAAFHFGASRRNRAASAKIPARHYSIQNAAGNFDMSKAVEEFVILWCCARGPVLGLSQKFNPELCGDPDPETERLKASEMKHADAWYSPHTYLDELLRGLPMNQGARESIYSEFLRDCFATTGVNYEDYRQTMAPSTQENPAVFTRLGRCDPLGVARVVRPGLARNLVYDSEFAIPSSIPAGAFIFAPNRSAIRYGNKTIFSPGIIALLSDSVRGSDFKVPDEKKCLVTDIATSSLSRGKEERALAPIGVCAPDAFQLILRKESLLSGELQVAASTGPWFDHPTPLRKAIVDFHTEVRAVLKVFSERGVLTRANQNLGTKGNFADLVSLTDAYQYLECKIECARLLPQVYASPRCPTRIKDFFKRMNPREREEAFTMIREYVDEKRNDVRAFTYGDDSLGLFGGKMPRALMILAQVHFFLIDQQEHPSATGREADIDPTSKSTPVCVMRDGVLTGAYAAWCSRIYQVEVRSLHGKQMVRTEPVSLFRSGPAMFNMGLEANFLAGTDSPHNWANAEEVLGQQGPDELHGSEFCMDLLACLHPEVDDHTIDREALRPYTISEDRFRQFSHLTRHLGADSGPVRLACSDKRLFDPREMGEDAATIEEYFANDILVRKIESLHGRYFAWTQQVDPVKPIFPTDHDAGARAARVRTVVKYTNRSALQKVYNDLSG